MLAMLATFTLREILYVRRIPRFLLSRKTHVRHRGRQWDSNSCFGSRSTISTPRTRAPELGALVVLDVHRNPNADHRELWIRDPDGYTVVIASPDGDLVDASQPANR